MSERPVHLVKSMHDVVMSPTEIWCDGPWLKSDATEDMGRVTCIDCLTEAVAYGNAALARRGELRRAKKK